MLNEPALEGLIEESNDLHADAMRDVKPNLALLEEHRLDVPAGPVDPAWLAQVNEERRGFAQSTGKLLAGAGLLGTAFGASVMTVLSGTAYADKPMDIQILQTASSLELLAIATYKAALGLDFIANGNAVVKAFAETTMKQHDEHEKAFAAMNKTMGGKPQTAPNPKYAPVVEAEKPKLKGPADVVKLAATLEEVATETYLKNLTLLEDSEAKALFASVMGVECQHLAVLRAVGALVAAGPEGIALIAIPTDVAKLPAAAGSVAFPKPFEPTDKASPPAEGAVK